MQRNTAFAWLMPQNKVDSEFNPYVAVAKALKLD